MEVLYQRYFLRMYQNNMTALLILLVIIATTMIVVNYAVSSADSIMQVIIIMKAASSALKNTESVNVCDDLSFSLSVLSQSVSVCISRPHDLFEV